MQPLPPYFLQRPALHLDRATRAAFARLYVTAVAPGGGALIDYALAAPKWQFLCWMSDTLAVVLHGSGDPAITEFEPRQSNDVEEFGNRRAVYAASDGLWAMYFAIVDRARYVTSLMNACFRVVDPAGHKSDPYYFFSINGDALPHQPWRQGTVYLLPQAPFTQQPPMHAGELELDVAQWASPTAVQPLAKLAVGPDDFPFLTQIVPHDPATVQARAAMNPGGFPWLDE